MFDGCVLPVQGSDIQLAFGFDDSLESMEGADSGPSPVETHEERDEVTYTPTVASPTSPATQELNSKIASCKNCWELPTVFEQK